MPDMTPDDLARIEARARAAQTVPWRPERDYSTLRESARDVPALVAALREAWAERDAARTLADDNWRSLEREATEHARTLELIGAPKMGEPLSEGEQARFAEAVERGLRKRAEDQRDEARAALARVTALCDDEAWKVSDFWLMGDAIRAAITGPTPTEGDTRA